MREFLKGLELEKDVIDKIMAEHGKTISDLKEQISDLKTNVGNLKEEMEIDKETIEKLYTEVDEKNETLKNLEGVTNEKNDLQMQLQMRDVDVKPEFLRFVTSEVKQSINDENTFDDVLKKYKEDNPQYFGETVIKKTQTSPDLKSDVIPTKTNDIMNDILRGKSN